MTIDAAEVARILGGEKTLHARISTLADLQRIVAAGLPVSALNQAALYIGGSRREANALKDRIVPRSTRHRRTRLKPEESERVERIARVMVMAEEVWESREDAREFLNEPQPMLDGRVPLDLARSELGARQVEDLLMKLEYSLPV